MWIIERISEFGFWECTLLGCGLFLLIIACFAIGIRVKSLIDIKKMKKILAETIKERVSIILTTYRQSELNTFGIISDLKRHLQNNNLENITIISVDYDTFLLLYQVLKEVDNKRIKYDIIACSTSTKPVVFYCPKEFNFR